MTSIALDFFKIAPRLNKPSAFNLGFACEWTIFISVKRRLVVVVGVVVVVVAVVVVVVVCSLGFQTPWGWRYLTF